MYLLNSNDTHAVNELKKAVCRQQMNQTSWLSVVQRRIRFNLLINVIKLSL